MPIKSTYLAKGFEDLNGKLVTPDLPGGYSYPLSPTGKCNVLGAPPYHFAGEEMNIVYQADPEAVKAFLPYPFEPSLEAPGECVLHMNSYVSRIADDTLLVDLPERCNYNETYLEARCRFKGQETKVYLNFWVNKDFSMLRGWLTGSQKKFGETEVTFEKCHLFDLNPYLPQVGPGFEIGGMTSAHMEKVVYAKCTLDKLITAEELHPAIMMGTNNILIYPDFSMGYKGREVNKVIHSVCDTWYGDVWQCRDASIEYYDSVCEEHSMLKPIRIDASYYYKLGFTIYGHIVDYDINKEEN